MAPGFAIRNKHGNIFEVAEDRTLLVHAVNCQGVWGMGIAYQIKRRLPKAFTIYRDLCRNAGAGLIGTCLLIPPQPADYELKDGTKIVYGSRYWIGCLFTSTGYGKKNNTRGNPGRNTADKILQYTKTALEDLRMQVEAFGPSNFDVGESWRTDDEKPGQILAVKFNSGAFGVPWELTEALVLKVFAGFEQPWYVVHGNAAPAKKHERAENSTPWVIDSQLAD